MRDKTILILLLPLLGVSALRPQAPIDPAADLSEFQVSSHPGAHYGPAIARDASGAFVVVWADVQDGFSTLNARRYASSGEALTDEIRLVEENVFGYREVVSDAAGNFVTVWSEPVRSSGADFIARRFSSTGDPMTERIRINSLLVRSFDGVSLAATPSGGFVAAWSRDERFGPVLIHARRFSGDGLPSTDEIQVNVTADSTIRNVGRVLVEESEDFAVIWTTRNEGFFARRFSSGGLPLTDVIRLGPESVATFSAATTDTLGRHLVVWSQPEDEATGEASGTFARWYSPAFEPLGEAMEVSSDRVSPSVALSGEGGFLALWRVGENGVDLGFAGRHFTSTGRTEGGLIRLTPYVGAERRYGKLALSGDFQGNYVALYTRQGKVYGRHLPAGARAGSVSFATNLTVPLPADVDAVTAENPATVDVSLARTGGALGEVSVDVVVTGGNARAGEDYQYGAQRVAFREGEPTWKTVAVRILEDDRGEDSEDLVLRLVEPSSDVQVVEPADARLRIYDDDFNPADLVPERLGEEIVVSSSPGSGAPASHQVSPAMAIHESGEIVVVWERREDREGWDRSPVNHEIFARRFDAHGQPVGAEVRVTGAGQLPAVATDGDGFVVMWLDRNPGERGQLEARRHHADGRPRGDVITVDAGDCEAPSPSLTRCRFIRGGTLARGRGGDLLAAWSVSLQELSPSSEDFEHEMALGRIAADGTVEIHATGRDSWRLSVPDLVSDDEGNAVVTWSGRLGIHTQRLDSDARPVGGIFVQDAPVDAEDPRIALGGEGGGGKGRFVVTWSEKGSDLPPPDMPGNAVGARRLTRNLQPLSGLFRPYEFAAGDFDQPAVASSPEGHFLMAWSQSSAAGADEDGSGRGVFARRYNWRWGSLGGEFQVNTTTAGDQRNPALAVSRNGTYAVAWESEGADGLYDLRLQRFAPARCVDDATTVCLQDGRFRVEVAWRDFQGREGSGRAGGRLTRDTGYFWFFDDANVELVVKVLDGRAANGQYWVFYGSLTNVAYTLTVTDTFTGEVSRYTNPAGRFASAGDSGAFPGDDLGRDQAADSAAPEDAEAPRKMGCAADGAHLCLNDQRFEIEATWKDFQGQKGRGHAIPLTDDTGYFWFFSDFNVEVVVKVLDGREINGRFWVFYGALSNVEYTLTVRDTVTGLVREYNNPAGSFGSIGDTGAL